MIKLGIMGDFVATNSTHVATNQAFEHVATHYNLPLTWEWIDTERIEPEFDTITQSWQGFLIAPGSPYKSMQGVLKIIEYARLNKVPTLGTCGGFQHMIIEFARNVLGIAEAEHAETSPYASKLVINPLSCNLKGDPLQIEIVDDYSLASAIYKSDTITENYYCNFGLNPVYQEQLDEAGFAITGSDVHKEARIMELKGHPFFVATLFVPQVNSTPDKPHPIIAALVNATEQHSKIQDALISEQAK